MDKQTAINLIANTFNQPFNESRFSNFVRNLFNDIDKSKTFEYHGAYIPNSFKDHIRKYKRLGKYTDPEGNKLDVLIVHLKQETALERARTMQRNFTARYLKERGEKDAAVVAYHTDNPDDWRFSYVRMEYRQEVTDSGKVKVAEELTPARRYSFLVGKNEPSHTAQQQLVPILQDVYNNPSLVELEKAFSVEAVTKQFYQDYKGLFEKLTEELDSILKKDSKIKIGFEARSIDPANFAKKLLGQIVFLYFLQKKGWLGVGRGEGGDFKPWGTGPKNFLRRLFEKQFISYDNFFNDVLEPLFYEALATERTGDYCSRLNCKIPFLNGGLFEPIGEYNWQETDILIRNNLFAKILDTFDLYNFTVREDEPLEKEVAVDPEMLGKVFENLLPENLRKGQGAYYTPREIVHYMCQESLINYLDTAVNHREVAMVESKPVQMKLFGKPEPEQLALRTTGYCPLIPRKDIEDFIRKGEFAIEHDTAKEEGTKSYKYRVPESIRKNARTLDEKLADIKICDPAIGSGAFPVGMMHEIIKARDVLTTYLSDKSRSIYDFKRHCIQESLYGVDIDPGAIEIAKLRLWLSLVVDEEEYQTIKPLPNLDYKIMQGNSLIEDFHGISLDLDKKSETAIELFAEESKLDELIEDLHQKQNALFNATHPGDKKRKKEEV
ncbi:class I SAM-dependent DNA methyltransferase, partial [bacterium]|nr:class I SAM-dependent DNA methyltransferase [bacterium]